MAKAKTYTVHGQTKTVADWAKQAGMCPQALRKRLRDGWPIQAAMTAKSHTRHKSISPHTDLMRQAEQDMLRLSFRLARSLAFNIDVRSVAESLHGPIPDHVLDRYRQ